MAPVVAALELWVRIALVVVRELNAVPAPTAPDNVTIPALPPFKISICPLSIVLEKLMFEPVGFTPPLVVSTVTPVERLTGPFIATDDALVVKLPPNPMAPV